MPGRPKFSYEQAVMTARERLAAHVMLIPFSSCHYFTGSLSEHGYGSMRFNGKTAKAHRVAYELANGPIPDREGYHGSVVMHLCDEPSCVNPAHLRLGSQQDNLRDKVAKGRQYGGERHHARKLTNAAVAAVKSALRRGEAQADIAKRHRVSAATISEIHTGRAHRFVGGVV